jgi:hypothetical protein
MRKPGSHSIAARPYNRRKSMLRRIKALQVDGTMYVDMAATAGS